MYKISSIFKSIQGEGINIGYPAIFIRLYTNTCFPNTKMRCPWCDTVYTDYYNNAKEYNIDEIITKIIKLTTVDGKDKPHVVITGGEPFLVDISPIIKKLHDLGYHIEIETNGSFINSKYDLTNKILNSLNSYDTINISPKLFFNTIETKILDTLTNYPNINKCFKYIISSQNDINKFENEVYPILNSNNVPHNIIYLTPVTNEGIPNKEIKDKTLELVYKYNLRYGFRGQYILFGNVNYDI